MRTGPIPGNQIQLEHQMKTAETKINEAKNLTSRVVNRVDQNDLSKEYKRLLKQELRRKSRQGSLLSAAEDMFSGGTKSAKIRAQITSNINADNGVNWAW
jgi:hypothetical protein